VRLGCGWLIDATGRRSAVARRAGATRLRDDALVAFYARFRAPPGADCDSRTAVESGPDGWWYTALVPSGERVVAFLTDADLIDRAAMLSPSGFAERLGTSLYIHSLLTACGYQPVGPPRGADAGTARLDCAAGAAWVAVGDAALALDPLSSQGILTALYTGVKAGSAVGRALVGDSTGIEEYAQQVAEIDRAYKRNWEANYAAEVRWSARPFWQRRQT
jgi:flavin-dependent dehydrogenase